MQIILRLYQVEEELISVPPPHAPPRPLPHFALPQPSSTPTSPALCSTSAFIHPDLSRTLLYLSLHPPRPLPHFALPQPSSTPTSPALCSTSAFIHPDLSRTLLYLSLHPPRPLPHFALPQPSSLFPLLPSHHLPSKDEKRHHIRSALKLFQKQCLGNF